MKISNGLYFILILKILLSQPLFAFDKGHKEVEIDKFFAYLRESNIQLAFVVSRYDYDYHHSVINTQRVALQDYETFFSVDNSDWRVILDKFSFDSKTNLYMVTFAAEILDGELENASIGLEFRLSNWKLNDYLLMPAAAYNGNRFESRRITYSPKLLDPKDIGPDKGIIVSDIPRLNIKDGPSKISLRSGDLAAPFVGIHHENIKKGFLLQFNPQNKLGDHGLLFQENRNRDEAVLRITSPVVREGYRYFITDNQFDSKDSPYDFKRGENMRFEIHISSFQSEEIQTVYDKFFDMRFSDFLDRSLPSVHPFSSVFQVQEKKFNEQNFVQEHGYYSVGMRETYTQDWAIGWTGGMISTYPLYFAGGEGTKENVVRNFDWLFPKGIAPSGFFWETGEKGTIWYGGDQRKFHTKEWHIIRRSADAMYFILKQLFHFKQVNAPISQEWEQGVKTVADAFVNLWNSQGQFGQFVNSISGKVEVGGSTSAAIAPAGLVYAYQYFGVEDYLKVALESAESYYQNYVKNGITCGGPADAMQNPDSESSYSMLESFLVIYEFTKDPKWLQRSKEMAHQFSTWVMPYNYSFPEESLFGKMDFKTVGTVWANTQNKHSAPGICTHSGTALLRLYRFTGDLRYAQLLQEIARAIPQYISHPDKPIGNMKIGWISERVNTTDWLEGIGEMMYMSTWAETAMMLTILEVPGLYFDADKLVAIAFDNVDCKIVHSDSQKVVIEVANPTPQNAEVTYFIEGNTKFSEYYGNFNKTDTPIITLKSGEVKRIRIDRKKKIIL
jgi:hypothetical protein